MEGSQFQFPCYTQGQPLDWSPEASSEGTVVEIVDKDTQRSLSTDTDETRLELPEDIPDPGNGHSSDEVQHFNIGSSGHVTSSCRNKGDVNFGVRIISSQKGNSR